MENVLSFTTALAAWQEADRVFSYAEQFVKQMEQKQKEQARKMKHQSWLRLLNRD